ncbi:MAG: FAD-dependent oxidoreductase, partial [Raoultibacter sp.]
MTQNTVSRRGFITGATAAAALAAVGLAGCSTNKPATQSAEQTWDRETDVVICGGGGTGLAAAVEAGRAGVETLVLEKSDHAGGTTA